MKLNLILIAGSFVVVAAVFAVAVVDGANSVERSGVETAPLAVR